MGFFSDISSTYKDFYKDFLASQGKQDPVSQQDATKTALDKADQNAKLLNTDINTDSNVSYLYGDWLGNQYLQGADGQSYLFVPKDTVNKGVVFDAWWGKGGKAQAYNTAFLNKDTFKDASQYTYNGTDGFIWKTDDAINKGIVKQDYWNPMWKTYLIDDNNPAIAGIGYPTYAPSQYTSQISYVSQPKQLSSSSAKQQFINSESRFDGSLSYEYVYNGWAANFVRGALPTINLLAPILLDVFVGPGTGASFAIGESMGVAAVTGNWEKGIVDAAKIYAIQQGSAAAGNYIGAEFKDYGQIAQSIMSNGTANAVQAAILGRDPMEGFVQGGIAGAVSSVSRSIAGFKDLPVPVQKIFAAGMGATLQGKSGKQVDQAVMTAAIRSGLEAMGNAMDANKYFKDKMGREPTAEELNKFTWYTDRSQMQKSLDNYAQVANKAAASGVNLTDEQINKILTEADPVSYGTTLVNDQAAKDAGFDSYAAMQEAKNLGFDTSEEYTNWKNDGYAQSLGFTDYAEMQDAIKNGQATPEQYRSWENENAAHAAGFSDYTAMQDAKANGITDAKEYNNFLNENFAKSQGFDTYSDMQDAIKNNVATPAQYTAWKNNNEAKALGYEDYASMQESQKLGLAGPTEYKSYVDEHTITLDEARQIAKDAGYQLSDEDLQKYLGRTPDPEEIKTKIEAEVDPQVVSQKEVIDEFAARLGRYPTQDEIDKYTGHKDQAQTTTQIDDYIESIAIRPDEVNTAFKSAFGRDATDAEIAAFVGEKSNKDLAKEITNLYYPDFNPDDYKAINKDVGSEDPYEHFINGGAKEGLTTNFNDFAKNIFNEFGVDPSKEELASAAEHFKNAINTEADPNADHAKEGALADQVVRDSLLRNLDEGNLSVKSADYSSKGNGDVVLSNGVVLHADGSMTKDGNQIFGDVSDVKRPELKLTDANGNEIVFDSTGTRLRTEQDVKNLFQQDYGLEAPKSSVTDLANTAWNSKDTLPAVKEEAKSIISDEFKKFGYQAPEGDLSLGLVKSGGDTLSNVQNFLNPYNVTAAEANKFVQDTLGRNATPEEIASLTGAHSESDYLGNKSSTELATMNALQNIFGSAKDLGYSVGNQYPSFDIAAWEGYNLGQQQKDPLGLDSEQKQQVAGYLQDESKYEDSGIIAADDGTYHINDFDNERSIVFSADGTYLGSIRLVGGPDSYTSDSAKAILSGIGPMLDKLPPPAEDSTITQLFSSNPDKDQKAGNFAALFGDTGAGSSSAGGAGTTNEGLWNSSFAIKREYAGSGAEASNEPLYTIYGATRPNIVIWQDFVKEIDPDLGVKANANGQLQIVSNDPSKPVTQQQIDKVAKAAKGATGAQIVTDSDKPGKAMLDEGARAAFLSDFLSSITPAKTVASGSANLASLPSVALSNLKSISSSGSTTGGGTTGGTTGGTSGGTAGGTTGGTTGGSTEGTTGGATGGVGNVGTGGAGGTSQTGGTGAGGTGGAGTGATGSGTGGGGTGSSTSGTGSGASGSGTGSGSSGSGTGSSGSGTGSSVSTPSNLGSTLASIASFGAMPIGNQQQNKPLLPTFLYTGKEDQNKFESPLEKFLQEQLAVDYTNNQNYETSQPQETQEQPMKTSFYDYGEEPTLDEIFNQEQYQQNQQVDQPEQKTQLSQFGSLSPMYQQPNYQQFGALSPVMAATGGAITGTRHGHYAHGGMATPLMAAGGKLRVDFRHGDAVTGPGDGQSDDIPAMLADGEFVFPADVVAALGNGSTKAGSDKLYDMMHSIRAHVRSAKPKDLPPEINSPLDFLKHQPKKRARSK